MRAVTPARLPEVICSSLDHGAAEHDPQARHLAQRRTWRRCGACWSRWWTRRPACALWGMGPRRRDLERHFEGLPVYFTVRPCSATISRKHLHHAQRVSAACACLECPLLPLGRESLLPRKLTAVWACTRGQGMLKGEELSSAYASADVFMMPSETETLGFVALEAMASGLPVVAVAAGGLVDIVTQPGVIGALPASPAAHHLISHQF